MIMQNDVLTKVGSYVLVHTFEHKYHTYVQYARTIRTYSMRESTF